jgi:hypothetical protein
LTGPLVLLGVSLSERDEPAFFRAIVRYGGVLGALPVAVLMRMSAIAVRTARVSDEHRAVHTRRPSTVSATPDCRPGSSPRKRATVACR